MSGRAHARLFVGVFQSQLLPGLSTFDNNSQQNGSKNGEKAPRPGTGNPHEGPSVDLGHLGSVLLVEMLDERQHSVPRGPSWGHHSVVLGAIVSFLEPSSGHSSPKIDKVS